MSRRTLETPLHASLVRPILLGGAERHHCPFPVGVSSVPPHIVPLGSHPGIEMHVEGFGPARETFRRHGLRRNEVFELISYTILRGQSHNAQIEDESIARFPPTERPSARPERTT